MSTPTLHAPARVPLPLVAPLRPLAPPQAQRRKPRNRWAALAVGGVVFALGQWLLAYLLQDHCESWRDPVYGAKLERLERRQEVNGEPPSLLILGSSRVSCGIDARTLEGSFPDQDRVSVFNFGVPYGGPVLQLLTLQRLLDEGVRPQAVLVEIFPALYARGWDRREIRQYPTDRFRLREHEFARNWGEQDNRLRKAQLEMASVPGYTQRLKIVRDLAPEWLPPHLRTDWIADADDHGTAQMPVPAGPSTEVRARALKVAHDKYQPALSTFAVGEVGPAALRELLDLCRREKIKVQLVWMPEGPTFRRWYRPGSQAEFAAYLRQVSAEFGVAWIDAQDWMPEEAFLDSHHLLAEPARAFSHRLRAEVKLLGRE